MPAKKPRIIRTKKKDNALKTIPRCPKCGNRSPIKSGYVDGEQRWKCKECGYQYTRVMPRGRPLWQKSLAVFLYCQGVSLRAIGRIFQVQPSTALKWVHGYTKSHITGPADSAVSILELKDMQSYLKEASSGDSALLCIAIKDLTFKKGMGITINDPQKKRSK